MSHGGHTYAPTTLTQLRRLLAALTYTQGQPNGLTITEIHWKVVARKEHGGARPDQSSEARDVVTVELLRAGSTSPLDSAGGRMGVRRANRRVKE